MPNETENTGFEGAAFTPAPAPVSAAVVEDSASAKASFAGYPVTKYHPVYGKRAVEDPNEAAQVFQPAHDWFNTPGEADMHRTDREAGQVIAHNVATKVADKNAIVNGEDLPSQADRGGIVRNSVQAQESLDAGKPEPL